MVDTHSAEPKTRVNDAHQMPEVDLVRGKGKGCIILIHGAPGVGKTSTAGESIPNMNVGTTTGILYNQVAHRQSKNALRHIPIGRYFQLRAVSWLRLRFKSRYSIQRFSSITFIGDIGYEPQEVEKKLERLFNLALKWGCVLLLDEADVFLAKRNKDDVKRNGLVSGRIYICIQVVIVTESLLILYTVFLRILEYYSGILFLTTNRVGAIDDAFRSRLHLTLYYPRLDKEKSIKVWKMNIKRIQELSKDREMQGRAGISLDKKRLVQFATDNFNILQWNGRQIRNSFQTALALAEFEARKSNEKDPAGNLSGPKLSVKHFRTIALASQEFEEYLQQTHGRSEEKQAHYDKMRVEDFKDPGVRQSLKIRESSSEGSDGTTSTDDGSSASSDSGSDMSGKKKKSLNRVKSRDSVLHRPNMNRQKSRDSIISLKKQKKRSSLMEDESYPAIRRQKSRDSIVSLKKLNKKRSSQIDDEKKKRRPKMDLEIEGDSDSDDSNE